MSEIAKAVLTEARGWIGTPYHHQASRRGVGTDCLGLVRGVWRAVYGAEPEAVPAYTPDWAEPQQEERLWAAAARHFSAVSWAEAEAGDVLLFRMRRGAVAKHLGILSACGAAPKFIHAYSGHAVLESPLTPPWQRRVAALFRFPEEIS
ncbi:NlpC/P60 family protein [uncultured Lentibacter sp.]|uniref:NlpC/P60 family protein n=1 Tax=uncultured Lentibacter sp. TaxID=1659309 RepID=UPI00261AE3A3|nr:NlpC/P60 family protein [uncultured Lentibacter sp.]MCW1955631.1 NlpC/P60 family protein [Roseobacter sp.]